MAVMSTPVGLTPGQERILARVRERSPRIFNGRASRQIERLEELGLVTADWDADLDHTKGRLRWRITVTLTEEGSATVKQRSTCRWCKRPIQRLGDSPAFEWKSNFGLDNTDAGDRECEAAPNPDEGPMPGHDPGTAVMNQDSTVAYYPRFADAREFAAARDRYREAEAGRLPGTRADALRLVAGHLAGLVRLVQAGSAEEACGLLDTFLTEAELRRVWWAAGEVARRLDAMS